MHPVSRSKSLIYAAALAVLALLIWQPLTFADSAPATTGREHLNMDLDWRFAFGNANDPSKDFDTYPAGSTFSYLAKAGGGLGAASSDLDDRGWRRLNLPHDWAVEVPFNEHGNGSHGSKSVGRNFPETSVGWYRKSFRIPASDLGRHITIDFDGVFRDSQVWVNGFYLGRESSGYIGFGYDISDYLNYGGDNIISVRVDASIEEGWFYEGAGIYRHVWMNKTAPLHVAKSGTFVTTEVKEASAEITARATINNDSTNEFTFDLDQTVLDADGHSIASGTLTNVALKPGDKGDFSSLLTVSNPKLWSLETPYLHKLITTIRQGGKAVDQYKTPFGIRTLRWDANEGFFLNGKRVELLGVCNHQDHAGVGVAVPDELNVFRIQQLKKMGCNAIRTSHNPPAPELLDACDRMGMLVMDENREYGINPQELGGLERFMLRDRNHPCVVIWSLGNEEWNIESNEKGERITQTMQTFARRLDPSRQFTVAISGGWGQGSSISIDVMGFNYSTHGNTDQYHKQFPDKPAVATEDASTFSTRGIYVEDRDHQHLTAYDTNKPDWGLLAEASWKFYAARPYVAGLFQWTGLDYRGETTPFWWPAISSQFGIMDTCGFPKDNFYYYKAWWSGQPSLHLLPHWNWPGREEQDIDVWVQGNTDEVELFLNGASLGRKPMERNSHLQWKVKYAPGILLARGYNAGKEILTDQVETTGEPASIQLAPHQPALKADGADISVITVQANDAKGRMVPTASNSISFEITGPGKIIGVGNGDPSSHEADQFIEAVSSLAVKDWRIKPLDSVTNLADVSPEVDDANWQKAFEGNGWNRENKNQPPLIAVYRGGFELKQHATGSAFVLALRSVGDQQSVYLNGKLVAENLTRQTVTKEITLSPALLKPGKNVVAIVSSSKPVKKSAWDSGNNAHPNPAIIRVTAPSEPWHRSLFSGLAQIIVQSTGQPGEITLTAKSQGLSDGVLKIASR